MKKSIKTKNLLQWIVVVFAVSTLMIACKDKNSNDKNIDTTTQIVIPDDSLPPLNTDDNTSARPEPMKSKTGGN